MTYLFSIDISFKVCQGCTNLSSILHVASYLACGVKDPTPTYIDPNFVGSFRGPKKAQKTFTHVMLYDKDLYLINAVYITVIYSVSGQCAKFIATYELQF
jgi:hypothetical protein